MRDKICYLNIIIERRPFLVVLCKETAEIRQQRIDNACEAMMTEAKIIDVQQG